MSNSDLEKRILKKFSSMSILKRVIIIIYTLVVVTAMYYLSSNYLFRELSNKKMLEYKKVITQVYNGSEVDKKIYDPIIIGNKKIMFASYPMHTGYVLGIEKKGELKVSYHFQTGCNIVLNLLVTVVTTWFILFETHKLILYILKKNLLIFKIR